MKRDTNVHQCLLDETVLVFDRPVERGDERGRNATGTRFDRDRRRLHDGRRFLLERVDLEDRDAFAINGDLDFLALKRLRKVGADELARVVVKKLHREGVFSVGGEIVNVRRPAASSKRRSVQVPHLVDDFGDIVFRHGRRGMGIADGKTGDLVGGPDIGLHQGRGHRQGVRHIVEVSRAPIRRQQRVHVHFDREQVTDRVFVLSTIDAVKGRRGRMRAGSDRPIDPCLERQGHGFERFGLGARHARGRHHPGAQLPDDLLRLLRILLGMRNVHRG